MTLILISPLPEEGHILPTFALTRGLLARGHRVCYLAPADNEELIRKQGFDFVPLFPDLYPLGHTEAQRRSLQEARSLGGVLRALRGIAAHSRLGFARWLDGSADRLLAELAPDLVLVDSLTPMLALTAYKAGIPALLLSDLYSNARQPGSPPITSPLLPTGTLASRLRIGIEWRRTLALKAVRHVLMSLAGIEEDYGGTLRKLAAQVGFPLRNVRLDTALGPTLQMPELVTNPKGLDFPNSNVPERYFVESSIDLNRSQPAFPWERLDPSKALIYAAFGSQAHRSPAMSRMLPLVIEAARDRDDWQLVLATSEDPERLPLPSPNPSTVLVKSAPQLSLLARARLMITHGGTGSLRECLLFGVPMILMAYQRDHVGNAARVAYHGLGLREDPRKVTAQKLAADIERILTDEAVYRRLKAMQSESRRLEEERPSLEIIERYLAKKPPATAS